jgi:hypothetical protein
VFPPVSYKIRNFIKLITLLAVYFVFVFFGSFFDPDDEGELFLRNAGYLHWTA